MLAYTLQTQHAIQTLIRILVLVSAGTNQWIAHVWRHAADSCVFACMCRTMERKVVTGNPDILFEQVHEF